MSTALRFTVAEYDRMIEQGIFADRHDQRLELIHGEIREMTPPNPPHEDTVVLLMYWSVDHAPREQVRVRIQNSLGIPALDSVPEPDVAWMRARSYRRRRPQPADVLLLIEVAESSLSFDRGDKAPLYASAKIKDYWIVNARRHDSTLSAAPEGAGCAPDRMVDRPCHPDIMSQGVSPRILQRPSAH